MTAAWAEFERYEKSIRQESLKEGRKEGVNEGVKQALTMALLDLCEVLGIVVGEEQRQQLEVMDASMLERLFRAVKTRRAWPE